MKTKLTPKLFTIIFEDGDNFMGGTLLDTKWLEIPNKKIKRLFYKLPHGDFLCLAGYEKYYHMVEATKDLNGKYRGQVRLEYAYIMGKLGNTVRIYKINLKNKDAYITKQEVDINNTWIKKLNVNGWK